MASNPSLSSAADPAAQGATARYSANSGRTPHAIGSDPGKEVVGHGRRRLWAIYLVLMLLFAAYQGLNGVIGSPGFAPWKPFVWEVSSVVLITALVPLIVRFENRFRLDSRRRARILLAHAAGVLVFSSVHTSGMVVLRKLAYAWAGQSYDFGNIFIRGFYELQKDVILYGLVLVVVFAVREFRIRRAGELRAAQLAADLGEARLRHLTAQIEPHFLFNALNAISNRMHEDVAAADRMISQLGDLLRAAYEADHHLLVPLERELSWLTSYAAMMGERFRGQLQFEIVVQPGLTAVSVPRLLLQPLVENAIRHGLADGRGWLQVDVRREGKRLRCTVSDDGAGLPDSPVAHGTGLANISRRLELLFPGDHTLDLAQRAPRGAVVTVSFPVLA
jgi:two-component system, LytTR family, sensor kinase